MERQRLRHLATEAMAGALSRSLSTRERERGATIARQLLLLDPHHEKACRTLMQILADRGQSTAALGVYEAARQSVVSGRSVSVRVDIGGRRIIKKKNKIKNNRSRYTIRRAYAHQ